MNLLIPFLFLLCHLLLLPPYATSISAADNYQITVQVPGQFCAGFVGRAFLLETNGTSLPHFKAALSVESTLDGRYACSLDVFIGDVKVWSSGHFSPFYASDRCYLELTDGGDLRLKQGPNGQVGWRSGTNGQGVERLELLPSGNLVLLDAKRNIKWQSFNFPTNVMLRGQRLNVATRLTAPFSSNSSSIYSFEIQSSKLALYLNSNKSKYSYWEFKPPRSKNISFIQLGNQGLEIFDQNFKQFDQIWSSGVRDRDMRYLSVSNRTGNLGLYYYSPGSGKFEASIEALNETCELPSACKPYQVCTLSSSCSCIGLLAHGAAKSDCSYDDEASDGAFCNLKRYEMFELVGVESIFRYEPNKVNLSKDECGSLCMSDCRCKAVFYNVGECFLYETGRGIRQAEARKGVSYLIKLKKGASRRNGSFWGLKKWALVLIGVVDGLVLVIVFGGFGYYVIRKRRKNLAGSDTQMPS
uniref:Bulb-type lectin domain-containing protein n=1 Tax=Kalanchoe fedtschenkoi TaxID=63787 RepID=A0A7N0T6M8_KALFE